MCRRTRDVPLVALVLLAHVEHLGRVVREQRLELVHADRLDPFRQLELEHVAGNGEQADRVQAPGGLGRFVRRGGMDRDRLVVVEHEAGFRPDRGAVERHVHRAVRVARGVGVGGADVEQLPSRCLEPLERRLRGQEGPAVQRDDALDRRRPRRRDRGRVRDELLQVADPERLVAQPLHADRRGLLAAKPGAAEGAAGVAGVDLGLVGQLGQPPQRSEEILGALARLDREVGPRGVADQQRVAGQQVAFDEEAAVLGPVAGRVHHANRQRADRDLGAVLERLVRVLGLGERVDRDAHVVLEREAAVPGDVVGVVVRLQHAHDPHARPLGRREVGLDRVGGVDHHRLAGRLVSDQVGGAAEVVVHKLLEKHFAGDRTNVRR